MKKYPSVSELIDKHSKARAIYAHPVGPAERLIGHRQLSDYDARQQVKRYK